MNCAPNPRRGGILKVLLVVLVLVAAAAGVLFLIATHGTQMQEGIRERSNHLRNKVLNSDDDAPAKPPAQKEPAAEPAKPPAAREAPKPPAPSPAKPYTVKKPPPVAKAKHTVAKGETLYLLAETYYEDGSLWPIIAEANGIKDETSELKEGMVILIPGK